MYYARNKKGYSEGWIKVVKNSIAQIAPHYTCLLYTSYSKYIEYPEFEEYIKGHINDEWIGKVNELKTRLQRGKEIAEQINILGDDGVPVSYTHLLHGCRQLVP